jgi:hypothetical protein
MKIAYVVDSLVLSGAQKHLTLLVRGMNARGHEAIVFCLNNKVHAVRRAALIAAGADLRVIGKARVVCGAAILEVAAAIRRERVAGSSRCYLSAPLWAVSQPSSVACQRWLAYRHETKISAAGTGHFFGRPRGLIRARYQTAVRPSLSRRRGRASIWVNATLSRTRLRFR